ncbi:hypothetical protein AB4K20DRAFT_1945948 [Rhizopus microsporus]
MNHTDANLSKLNLKGKAAENEYVRKKELEQLKALKASIEKKQQEDKQRQ